MALKKGVLSIAGMRRYQQCQITGGRRKGVSRGFGAGSNQHGETQTQRPDPKRSERCNVDDGRIEYRRRRNRSLTELRRIGSDVANGEPHLQAYIQIMLVILTPVSTVGGSRHNRGRPRLDSTGTRATGSGCHQRANWRQGRCTDN